VEIGPESDCCLQRDGQGGVDAGDLLDRDAEGQEVGVVAAVALREGQTEQAQVTHLVHHVHGELVGGIPGIGVRGDRRLAKDRTTLRNASCSAESAKSKPTSVIEGQRVSHHREPSRRFRGLRCPGLPSRR
jgi:hypothetical protein